MTPLALAAVGVPTLTPIFAAADWTSIVQGGGTTAVIALLIYGLKLLRDGTLRLDREIQSEREARAAAETRAATAEARAVASEAKAEQEAKARAKIEEEVRTTLRPELLKVSTEATRMVEAGAHNAEMMSQLLTTLLPKMEKP